MIDAVRYRVPFYDLPWTLERELWDQARLTVDDLLRSCARGQYPPFMLGGWVFLARRFAGEQVSYVTIMTGITRHSEVVPWPDLRTAVDGAAVEEEPAADEAVSPPPEAQDAV